MNAKKVTNIIATALIAFVALVGVYPPITYAADFKPIFHTGAPGTGAGGVGSWCPGCNVFKGTPNGSLVDGLVKSGAMDYGYVGRGFSGASESLVNARQSIPALEYAPGQFMSPDNPGFSSKLNEIAKNAQPPKQQEEKICIVPRPGQSTEFGPITDNPEIYQPLYPLQDTSANHPFAAGHIADEADVNFQLRKLGSKKIEEHIAELEKQPREGATKKIIRPNQTQAEEYIKSMGGNPNTQGSFKIDGTDVPVGEYRANQQDQRTGITFDENCENPKKTGPAPDPGKDKPAGDNPFGNLGNGDGPGGAGPGGPGGGGLGGLGGLAALLPMLMQMLGQGGQQGQGQQGQGQYGAGYGNQQDCAAQPVAPVCGTDGRTYNNQCYLNAVAGQTGVTVRNTGVCASTSPTPTVTPIPNVNSIVTLAQLSQSGIPASLLDNVRNLVSGVLSTILSGANVAETAVR